MGEIVKGIRVTCFMSADGGEVCVATHEGKYWIRLYDIVHPDDYERFHHEVLEKDAPCIVSDEFIQIGAVRGTPVFASEIYCPTKWVEDNFPGSGEVTRSVIKMMNGAKVG